MSAYSEALADLARARAAAAATGTSRAAGLGAARARLDAEQARLAALTTALGTPVTPVTPVTPTGSRGAPDAEADLPAQLAAATAAVDEAERVARLPRLLPEWESPSARAAVVHGAFGLVAALLTVALSVVGVHGSAAVLLWFVVVWPAVSALVGGALVVRLGTPPLPPPAPAAGTAPPRVRPYRWLGAVLAWAGWLVPGLLLDRIAGLLG